MMTATRMRYGVLGVAVALGLVTPMFACESTERASIPDSDEHDAGVDADIPITDAGRNEDADSAADDEFVVPDAGVACNDGPCAVAITGAGNSFCVLLQDGSVSCWGSNDQGQLGYEVPGDSFSATPRRASDLA